MNNAEFFCLSSLLRCRRLAIQFNLTVFILLILSQKTVALELTTIESSRPTQTTADILNSEIPISQTENKTTISTQSGTIIFWIKPSNESSASQTFLSAKLQSNQATPSYMVISNGWWENSVAKSIYFVIDNDQLSFCNADNITLHKNFWYQFALTWGRENGTNYCRIYINGEIKTERKISSPTPKTSEALVLFSDKYTDNPKNRTTQGLTSNWLHSNSVFSHQTIAQIFTRSAASHQPIAPSEINYLIGNKNSSESIHEIRALFDEDVYWALSKKNTDAALDAVERGGFNIYIPCVWHGDGAYYAASNRIYANAVKSRIANNDDPLAYLIQEAHKRKIAIHPWFTVARNDSKTLSRYATAEIDLAFDVHNEDFRNFITDLVIDVIKRYPVDGINLDYIRSMGTCKTKKCQEDFEKKYNSNLLVAAPLARALKHTPMDIRENPIAEWNAEALTSILSKISTSARSINPSIKISVDSHPLSPDFYIQGHDSIAWLNKGLIDMVFAMDYHPDPNVEEIDNAKNLLKSPEKLIPLLSVYDIVGGEIIPRSPEKISQYLQLTRTKWPNSGIAFYHRKQLTNEQLAAIKNSIKDYAPLKDTQIQ